MAKMPPPFKPLSAVARSTLPEQINREHVIARRDTEVVDELREFAAHPRLTITASITLPQRDGYARRLHNLLRSLQASLEEEAPWLSDVEITVSTTNRPR